MNESDFGPCDPRAPGPDSGEGMQCFLAAEERILQSISVRVPLRQVLNEICSALDFQIGNVISVISLPDHGAVRLAAIAVNAAQFGLHAFYSEDIVAGNGRPIASLAMYASLSRSPSAGELRLIQRAECLITIAIRFQQEAHLNSGDPLGSGPIFSPPREALTLLN